MTKAGYQWVVVPEDGFTNETIARELAATCKATGNETRIIDSKGIERKGYIVPHNFITALTKQNAFSLKYKVFVREGGGAYRESKLHKKKRGSRKVKEIKGALKKADR